jgi:hypothetical protein
VPVIPIRQCTKRSAFSRASLLRKQPARLLEAAKRLNGSTTLASALAKFASIAAVPPPPTLQQRADAVLSDGKQRYDRAVANRTFQAEEKPLLEAGAWEIGLVIEPVNSGAIADQIFMNTIGASNPNLTGWPIREPIAAYIDGHWARGLFPASGVAG